MNRALGWINLVGVLMLTALCVGQWQVNRRLNLQISDLEKLRLDLVAAQGEQQRHLEGTQADLERFRQQLSAAAVLTRDSRAERAALERLVPQLTAERDQLQSSLGRWTNAVKQRDDRLSEAEAQIRRLAEERNDVVGRFNELAAKYEQVVTELNSVRAQTAVPVPKAGP